MKKSLSSFEGLVKKTMNRVERERILMKEKLVQDVKKLFRVSLETLEAAEQLVCEKYNDTNVVIANGYTFMFEEPIPKEIKQSVLCWFKEVCEKINYDSITYYSRAVGDQGEMVIVEYKELVYSIAN